MTRRLDWERANKGSLPPYDPRPGEEISEALAKEDQEFLANGAAVRKKRTKYIRSSPRQRAVRKLMEAPETVQERRLRTVLASLTRDKSPFELIASSDASHRLFQRDDVKLRIRIDPEMRRQLVGISPGKPDSFGWITVSVAPGALEDRFANSLAVKLSEMIAMQHQLQQGQHA